MGDYYNDNDPFACEWMENLIAAGELPRGVVDGRSITEVTANDVDEFTQCHFFVGTGGWPLALKWAGWPEDRPVWTGSCPCQPFSQAGKGQGTADERHLWPEFLRLITECRPAALVGEQVASPAGREWLTGVRADLEALGYAVGAADLCAAGAGAPHIRQRLFWVAGANGRGESAVGGFHGGARVGAAGIDGVADAEDTDGGRLPVPEKCSPLAQTGRRDAPGGLGNTNEPRRHARVKVGYIRSETVKPVPATGSQANGLGDADSREPPQPQEQPTRQEFPTSPGTSWHNCQFAHCRDGKLRRVPDPESGILALAHGVPRKLGPPLTGMGQVGIRAARANRVGRLRGYGNALCMPVAVAFVKAYLEITDGKTEEKDED